MRDGAVFGLRAQVIRPEYRRVPTAMGPGYERADTALELQQLSDEGQTDQEPTSDLAQRAVTAVNRIENRLAEIFEDRLS